MTEEKLPSYGGQALIEGILMRGSKSLAAAMRDPNGKIIVKRESLSGIYTSKIKKIPFIRGLIVLWDALGLGTKYLTISANVQSDEDEQIEGPTLYISLIISLAIGIGIFFVAPAALSHLFKNLFEWSNLWSNLVEGILRLILIIAYIWSVGKIPDIKRVFMYHGAEHKTINAYEAGVYLTPENVNSFTCVHTRCGTAFLVILVVISIIVFSLLGPLSLLWRLLSRILLIPVLASIAYEYMRWTANHTDSKFVQFIIRPNLALQRLTTSEPDLSMIEVAITAFNSMIEMENSSET